MSLGKVLVVDDDNIVFFGDKLFGKLGTSKSRSYNYYLHNEVLITPRN